MICPRSITAVDSLRCEFGLLPGNSKRAEGSLVLIVLGSVSLRSGMRIVSPRTLDVTLSLCPKSGGFSGKPSRTDGGTPGHVMVGSAPVCWSLFVWHSFDEIG